MKKFFLLLLFCPGLIAAQQKLDLQHAYDLATANYPVVRQKDLVKQTADLQIENLQKNWLPQVKLSAEATYQSTVTKIDVAIPGFDFPKATNDQYKLLADINQMVYDGGQTREQKKLQALNADVEEQRSVIELNTLKERVNQLFLGVLFYDEQIKQVGLTKADIETGVKRLEAQVQNGVAFKSNLNMLKAESLKTEQRAIELRASRKGLLQSLSLFLGMQLGDDVQFQKPSASLIAAEDNIDRPELKLFTQQLSLAGQQNRLIDAKNRPRASLFVQGGYGHPGLNQFKKDFDAFAIGGVRFTWSLGNLYTRKKEKEIVGLNQKMIDIQRETFLLNTGMQLKQQEAEIDKWKQLVATDNEIITLRSSVKEAAKAQLDNGVITASDYLEEVNAEDQARQTLVLHSLQLLQAQINYQTILGKQ